MTVALSTNTTVCFDNKLQHILINYSSVTNQFFEQLIFNCPRFRLKNMLRGFGMRGYTALMQWTTAIPFQSGHFTSQFGDWECQFVSQTDYGYLLTRKGSKYQEVINRLNDIPLEKWIEQIIKSMGINWLEQCILNHIEFPNLDFEFKFTVNMGLE